MTVHFITLWNRDQWRHCWRPRNLLNASRYPGGFCLTILGVHVFLLRRI